ncbi:MAG: hypothetical protein KJO15_02320, partial [Alphaproteobacteria bacterium]|nr:hypothetical protein [Alphaproteobacteria bacterium]
MDNIAGSKPGLTWAVHLSVALLVIAWIFPTLGLFVSSFRSADQIATSGWWNAMFPSEQNLTLRAAGPDAQVQDGQLFVIEGNLFDEGVEAVISVWGTSSREIDAYTPGQTAELRGGGEITVEADGTYRLTSTEAFEGSRGPRVFATAVAPPEFSLKNYDTVLGQNVIQRLMMFLAAGAALGAVVFFSLRAARPEMDPGWVKGGAVVVGLGLTVILASVLGLSTGTAAGA